MVIHSHTEICCSILWFCSILQVLNSKRGIFMPSSHPSCISHVKIPRIPSFHALITKCTTLKKSRLQGKQLFGWRAAHQYQWCKIITKRKSLMILKLVQSSETFWETFRDFLRKFTSWKLPNSSIISFYSASILIWLALYQLAEAVEREEEKDIDNIWG